MQYKIKEATLLTVEDAAQVPQYFLEAIDNWWLRSDFYPQPGYAPYVEWGEIEDVGDPIEEIKNIRPALVFEEPPKNMTIGSQINIHGFQFIMVQNELALMNGIIGVSSFDNFKNSYKTSAIKNIVDNWFETEIKPYIQPSRLQEMLEKQSAEKQQEL